MFCLIFTLMRVLVCGGRDFHDIDFIVDRLLRLHERFGFTTIITGMARGPDRYAYDFAKELGIPTDEYPIEKADWNQYGNAAGPRRNQRMLISGKPELGIAFPGGRGTADMTRRLMGQNVPVWRSNLIEFNSRMPKHQWASNFATGFDFVDCDGCVWPTAEHYYQSRKTEDEEIRGMIQGLTLAKDAKRCGAEIPEPDGWNPDGKIAAMSETIQYKFAFGSEAAKLLLGTGEDYLQENASWESTSFWGMGSIAGQNRLGWLLMDRRDALQEQTG
jgi:predicted NAD-dependent protein-ADP-ribosyltransferase YbiA (DUF1768 family)